MYEDDGRSIFDKYIKFRLNFIIEFVSILLPIKIDNDKSIRAKLYNYYILSKFEKANFDELINNCNTSLKSIFESNNITIKEIQELCFCLVDINTLFEWKNKPDTREEIRYRKSIIDLATTIYIAMQYEKNIFQNSKASLSFEETNKKVLRSINGIIEVELIIQLNEKKKRLEKLCNNYIKSNKMYVDRINSYNLFKGQILKINNKKMPLYISNLTYDFKEFKDESGREIEKVRQKESIQTNLNKIEIDIITLFVGFQILKDSDIKVIIELNSGFFSNKNNYLYLLKRINILKKYIFISIQSNSVNKFSEYIDELNKKGYEVIVSYEENENDKTLDSILRKTKYLLVKYSDEEKIGKLLSKCKMNRTVPIVLNIKNSNIVTKYEIEYYTLSRG